MNEAELRHLISTTETRMLECKPRIVPWVEIGEYAVGIGNAGGGLLVMGVSNRLPRKLLPIEEPTEKDLGKIRDSVNEATGIHIDLDVVRTAEGPVLVATLPGRPRGTLFHTRNGKYLIRHEDALRGMTLEEIDAVRREAGVELTARVVDGSPTDLLRPSALEEMRRLMSEANAPKDLLALPDIDLLRSLGVLAPDDRLLVAGLLLAGRDEALHEHVPHARWRFLRMVSDTEYDQCEEGNGPLPLALKRLRELVAPNNPIITLKGWLVHPEFPRYPVLALRELIVNALVHRDYERPGETLLKIHPDRLEISNPGGFVADITPQNILHHPSAPRYPALFQALARMRLANAANLGVPRVFRELLAEGKEPPYYWSSGSAVRVTVHGQEARREFIDLVHRHPDLDVDHLLVIHYLTRHREITIKEAAGICQRPMEGAREILGALGSRWRLVEPGGGAGRGRYWRLSRGAYEVLLGALKYHVDRRLTAEHAKSRILAVLGERSLSNAEVREITQMGRAQALALMKELEGEGLTHVAGRGRGARWLAGPGGA